MADAEGVGGGWKETSVARESELGPLEQHLLACGACADRAAEAQDYVDAIRRGIIDGNLDLATR
jgi:hypothetical protein